MHHQIMLQKNKKMSYNKQKFKNTINKKRNNPKTPKPQNPKVLKNQLKQRIELEINLIIN